MAVKGIMLSGDFTLNSANLRTKEVTFSTINTDWGGNVYLSAVQISGGPISLTLGGDEDHPIIVDSSSNYAGELNVRKISGFKATSLVDSVIRIVVEIL